MSNILKAFINIVNNYQVNVANITHGNNRANNMGEGLEAYIKKAFANNFQETNIRRQKSNLRQTFSYIGATNSPPDIILTNSDAIEIKKTETVGTLQFNSSQPKPKLYSTNPRISDRCKNSDNGNWTEKDIIYTMGHIPKDTKQLKSLWFVYGTCYAANENIYQAIETRIKQSLDQIDDLSINIDSLDITYLRIRGMWVIKHPSKVFDDLYEQTNEVFNLIAIIPIDKYNSFPIEDRTAIESIETIVTTDEIISDPNNAADTMNIKLLVFRVT
ncbi:NgoPII family restriction endonuclease [Sulfurimonas sp.]|uniref:NgoPII family restriction endonuclease n=1 Tax=Sulfurimonas sp. TaxID=2022749 RepID=UPI002B466326|nr:NgoPII family restriction endonuclease [Sulfurimonas sp.]